MSTEGGLGRSEERDEGLVAMPSCDFNALSASQSVGSTHVLHAKFS